MTKEFTNKLISESSPYLLQHAHNPVDWHAWGQEALNKAKQHDKLLLISIGYSACHWCHVMEHESFEDKEVAEIMNQNFINIKVDREERPDIDHIYMNAVQMLTGQGGWPLNCFALPDGTPIWGGTYFPRETWINILNQLVGTYKSEKNKVITHAQELKNGITQNQLVQLDANASELTIGDHEQIIKQWQQNFDNTYGGQQGAPKFPMPVSLNYLMAYAFINKDKAVTKHVELTLDKMAGGGIYDHLAGGFARYSVDEKWHIPHFEKMLYDNAQLVSMYAQAYQFYKKPNYKRVVNETLTFLENNFRSPEGGFYAALDADSENEEGKFYVWKKHEIDEILKEDRDVFCNYYNITDKGNWEDGLNVLHVSNNTPDIDTIALETMKLKLLKARSTRIAPGLDNKILCSWNALMVTAYTSAFKATCNTAHFEKANELIHYITNNFLKNNCLVRAKSSNGKSVPAFLDDYALFIQSLLNFYQLNFNEEWIHLAENITQYCIENFYDKNKGYFLFAHDSETAIETYEIQDNVIPSSNSVMALNLFYLHKLTGKTQYENLYAKMLEGMAETIKKHAPYHANWAFLSIIKSKFNYELAILGSQSVKYAHQIQKNYYPGILLSGSNHSSNLHLLKNRYRNNKTLIYVCQNNTCNLPVKTPAEAMEFL